MSKNEIVAQIEALNEWESVIAEAQAEAEAIRDSIKAEMLDRDAEELQAGKYIVRWTPVLSNRFDSTSFKKQYGELYSRTELEQMPVYPQEGYIQQIDGVVVVKISDDYKVDKEFAPLIDLGELFQLIMDDINDS